MAYKSKPGTEDDETFYSEYERRKRIIAMNNRKRSRKTSSDEELAKYRKEHARHLIEYNKRRSKNNIHNTKS